MFKITAEEKEMIEKRRALAAKKPSKPTPQEIAINKTVNKGFNVLIQTLGKLTAKWSEEDEENINQDLILENIVDNCGALLENLNMDLSDLSYYIGKHEH